MGTERAMDGNAQSVPPVVKVPTSDQIEELEQVSQKIKELKAEQQKPIPEVDAEQRKWEIQLPRWTILQPITYASAGGAKLEVQVDNSVLASGENPDREVYQIEAKLKAGYYTAIRLEGLTDQSLPHKGAGRSENSNVVLSEFE